MQAAGTNRVTLALLTAASFLMGAACSSAAGYAGAGRVLLCLCACLGVFANQAPVVAAIPLRIFGLFTHVGFSCRNVGVCAGQRTRSGRSAALSARGAGGGAASGRLLWHARGWAGELAGWLSTGRLAAMCGALAST